jgi:hypothetical protein
MKLCQNHRDRPAVEIVSYKECETCRTAREIQAWAKKKEEAKAMLRVCNVARPGDYSVQWALDVDLWLNCGIDPSGDCCPECSTPDTLRWVWPDLEDYKKKASRRDWINQALKTKYGRKVLKGLGIKWRKK